MNPEQILLHEDCRTHAPGAYEHHLTISDLPYSEHVHHSMTSCAQHADVKGVRHRDAGFSHLSSDLAEHFAAVCAAGSGWRIVYSDVESCGQWVQRWGGRRAGKQKTGYVRAVPWIRWSSPQQSGDRPPQGWEVLCLGHSAGRMVYRGPGNLIELRHKCLRGLEKHPTEKPLDQMLDLISWFSAPGDIVREETAGSGVTGVACALLGRNYIGFEHHGDSQDRDVQAASAHWAMAGAERIEAAARGELSARDRERLVRWVSTVNIRTSYDGPEQLRSLQEAERGRTDEDAVRIASTGVVPVEYRDLRKGALR